MCIYLAWKSAHEEYFTLSISLRAVFNSGYLATEYLKAFLDLVKFKLDKPRQALACLFSKALFSLILENDWKLCKIVNKRLIPWEFHTLSSSFFDDYFMKMARNIFGM